MTGSVLDTSAVAAVLFGEPDGGRVLDVLDDAGPLVMSAATLVELGIVLEARYGPVGAAIADRFVREAGVEIVPVDRGLADRAVAAWRKFGRGRHPASLNYGDCFTYALAEEGDLPVVCTGEDFALTGLTVIP